MKQKTKQVIALILAIAISGSFIAGAISLIILNLMH